VRRGDRWFVDETYVKVAGRWVYLYRAIDQFGQLIDVVVFEKRDMAATRRFFTRALEQGPCPTEVTTDRAAAYPRVLEELVPGCLSCHRAIRQQRDRSRPWTTEIPAASDARTQTAPLRTCGQRRARVHPEHPPRALRT
jgi:transposase-like protein